MKAQTMIMLAGGAVAAYLAYQWYQGQAAAAASSATSTTSTTSTAPADPTSSEDMPTGSQPSSPNYQAYAAEPPGWGSPMYAPAPAPAWTARPPAPKTPMSFGSWYASRPSAVRLALSKLTYPQRLARYRSGYLTPWQHGQYGGP